MKLDKLFELLHESGAETLTMLYTFDDEKPKGVVVLVSEAAASEFLIHMERWEQRKPAPMDTPAPDGDDYGWDT